MLIPIRQFAKLIGKSPIRVHQLILSGDIPAARLGKLTREVLGIENDPEFVLSIKNRPDGRYKPKE